MPEISTPNTDTLPSAEMNWENIECLYINLNFHRCTHLELINCEANTQAGNLICVTA